MKKDTPSFVWHEWYDDGPLMGHIKLPENVVAIGCENSVRNTSSHFSQSLRTDNAGCHVMPEKYLSRIQELLEDWQNGYGHLSWIRNHYFDSRQHFGLNRRVDIMSYYGHHIQINKWGDSSKYTRSAYVENHSGLRARSILVTVPDFWWPITAGEDITLIEDVILDHLWGYETVDEG